MTISVLLVDDQAHPSGPTPLLRTRRDFDVVGEAGSVADAERLLRITRPDVVVLDVRLPDGSGLKLAAGARERYPQLGIVILTMYAGDEQLFAALEAGASAFVPKNAPSDDVVAAARHAATTHRPSPRRISLTP